MIKFYGDPYKFFKFEKRFRQMVESQDLSDAQKMSCLLQLVDCNAKKAVAGVEGTLGEVNKAMGLLEIRFG